MVNKRGQKASNWSFSFLEGSPLQARVLGSMPKGFCQFFLGYAEKATSVDYPFPEGFSVAVEGHIAEKFDDSWDIM